MYEFINASINEKIIPFYEPSPIALGTILFASTFLCTDILSEYYGKEKARKNVLIGFCSFLLMTILMLVTIGIQPAEDEWVSMVQESLAILFTPMTSIFVASMIAYLISQYFDIWFNNSLTFFPADKDRTENLFLFLFMTDKVCFPIDPVEPRIEIFLIIL